MAHLLKYDSVLGPLGADVEATADGIRVGDGVEFRLLNEKGSRQPAWKDLGVEVASSRRVSSRSARTRRSISTPAPRRSSSQRLRPIRT